MGVDSYLELFTTMYGWAFSAVIRDVLMSTGLYALPFLVIVVGTWMEAHQQAAASEGAGAGWMIRKMEIELGVAIVVLALCFTTTSVTSLSNASLTYSPEASKVNPASERVTGTSSNSTYSSAFSDTPSSVEVPVLWYAVMSMSSGVSEAVKAGIGSNKEGYRALEEQVRNASIADPQLRAELQRFGAECFVPARSKYLAAQPASSQASAAIAKYGAGDPDWVGSHAFRDDPTLYPALFAESAVGGWPVDSVQDADVAGSDVKPQWGRPNCAQWWADGSIGIRQKLISSLDTTSSLINKVALLTSGASDEVRSDSLARIAVTKARPGAGSMLGTMPDNRTTAEQVSQFVPEAFGYAGVTIGGILASATKVLIIHLLRMMQPLILMALYMFMPFALLVGCYRLQTVIAGVMAIFTIKMWPMMWFIIDWLDDHLIAAMYPDAESLLEHFLHSPFDVDGFSKRAALNAVVILLYIGLPTIWTGMMSWAGIRAMHNISDMMRYASEQSKTGTGLISKKIGL